MNRASHSPKARSILRGPHPDQNADHSADQAEAFFILASKRLSKTTGQIIRWTAACTRRSCADASPPNYGQKPATRADASPRLSAWDRRRGNAFALRHLAMRTVKLLRKLELGPANLRLLSDSQLESLLKPISQSSPIPRDWNWFRRLAKPSGPRASVGFGEKSGPGTI